METQQQNIKDLDEVNDKSNTKSSLNTALEMKYYSLYCLGQDLGTFTHPPTHQIFL